MAAIAGRLAVAVGLVVLSVTGCGGGGGTETNGLEKKSAAEVLQAATAAFKASHGVHAVGTGTSDGRPARLDIRIQDGSASGTITIDGAPVEITTVGSDAYIRGDQQGLQAIGVSAETAHMAANHWLKSSPQELGLEGFTLDSFIADLAHPDRPYNPTVEQTELNGRKVVVVSAQDGTKLYVANTGPAYPLHVDDKGQNPGSMDLTEYGADFHITPPEGTVELRELAWLKAVEKLGAKMEKIFTEGPTDLTPSTMASLSEQLRGCRRGLERIPAPSERLRPAHALVEKACDEYDKGARCFATAARIGIPFAGTAAERKQSQALDCGFASSEALEPLTDALNQATEITSGGG
jgi:hypothetical protein